MVVDYIGIKSQMNIAMAQFSKSAETNFEEIDTSATAVKDHQDLLNRVFHRFDRNPYFRGTPGKQMDCLNRAAEFVQITNTVEKRFMELVKRLKAAYDVCVGSDKIGPRERDEIYFYLAVRSIVFKLTRGGAPDIDRMNARVRKLIEEALKSAGVEEVLK